MARIILFLLLTACGGNQYTTTHHTATTSKGIPIRATKPITPQEAQLIQQGIDTAIQKGGYIPYEYFDVQITEPSPQCSNGFLVYAYGWPNDGKPWDKDQREGHVLMCVAGQLHATHMELVSTNLELAARYETEHLILRHNNYERYLQTLDHGQYPHPLFP